MTTNNQNSLDGLLLGFAKELRDIDRQRLSKQINTYQEMQSRATAHNATLAAINKTIMEELLECLPDEKVGTDRIPLIDAERGYNIAIQDVRQQITTKYGRADNE